MAIAEAEEIVEHPHSVVAEWLSDVAGDPVAFVEGAFPWGEDELAGSAGPEPWQRWVLEQIRDGLLTPGQAIQIAIASGHGIGKTALVAWIVLWALSTFPDTRGIVTASSEPMLTTRVRAELRKWFRLFRGQEFFELTATALIARDPAHEQTWRVDLLPWNENRPEAFAGLHNAGRRILVVFDEASAIAPTIWETIEAVMIDANAEVIWLACGNPLHPVGRFRDCFERYAHRWITKHVDSRTVSFTNKAQFERWIADYGLDSNFIKARVLGELPSEAANQFISPIVDEAMRRELSPTWNDPLVIGVDVARFGDDMSVIYPRRGCDARSILPLTFRNIPLDRLEDQIVEFCNAHRVEAVFVDGTGVGGGVVDHLRRRGLYVIDVQFGAKPDQAFDATKYANKRVEIWGAMREALTRLCLPNNGDLREQLIGPEYTFNLRTEIQLEPKDAMKRRGLPSPDLADALAVTYAAPMAKRQTGWERPGQANMEYNPFDPDWMENDEAARHARAAQFVPAPGYPGLREDA